MELLAAIVGGASIAFMLAITIMTAGYLLSFAWPKHDA